MVRVREGAGGAQRRGRWVLIIFLAALSACSSTTFIDNRLDFLLPWYLGDYVDLSRAQKKDLDELLQPFLQWHRSQELPLYLDTLNQVSDTLDRTLELQDVIDISLSFENAYRRMESEGLEWMLKLGAKLSDEQIAQFLQQLNEKQVEYEEEYLTRSEQEFREDTYESLNDSLQDFMGKLDAIQQKTLRDTSASLQRSDRMWLEERAEWMKKLEVLLRREPGWQQRTRDSLAARDADRSGEYQQVYEHNMRQIQQAMVTVLNGRTEKQNRRLRKKLDNFREDLQILIDQGSAG